MGFITVQCSVTGIYQMPAWIAGVQAYAQKLIYPGSHREAIPIGLK